MGYEDEKYENREREINKKKKNRNRIRLVFFVPFASSVFSVIATNFFAAAAATESSSLTLYCF